MFSSENAVLGPAPKPGPGPPPPPNVKPPAEAPLVAPPKEAAAVPAVAPIPPLQPPCLQHKEGAAV